MPASREVMSAANTIDDQEESDGAFIEVNGELEEGLLSVVESDSKLVASPRLHEEGEGFWQEGENGRKGNERHEINTEKHLIPAQIVLVAIYFAFSRPYTSRTIKLNPFHHPLPSS
jgi:hypothetical protein